MMEASQPEFYLVMRYLLPVQLIAPGRTATSEFLGYILETFWQDNPKSPWPGVYQFQHHAYTDC